MSILEQCCLLGGLSEGPMIVVNVKCNYTRDIVAEH